MTGSSQQARQGGHARNRSQKPQDASDGAHDAAITPGHHKRARSQESCLPKQTEAAFRAEIIDFARNLGWTVYQIRNVVKWR